MKKLFSALMLAVAATGFAQTLPAVKLERVFAKMPELSTEEKNRPVWMSECPDGSGRMFIVYQPGTIVIV